MDRVNAGKKTDRLIQQKDKHSNNIKEW